MKPDYPEGVRRNILPRSKLQNLPGAFAEWRFTGNTTDYLEPIETCQLCEQEQLRYHFEIRNDVTGDTLLVGSQCILKFDVGVYDEGRRLHTAEARRKLDSLVVTMRFKACTSALEELAHSEANDILTNALRYYREHGYLTPKLAFVVIWRMGEHRIDHSPSFFKISLKRSQYRDDLAAMPAARVHKIWAALTPAQRRIAEELGHTPPKTN